ncbi:MAG: serine hydroxymethyltransferase [Candidatus Babeliales bacterium]
MRKLNVTDPEIFTVIHKETRRQEEQLTLIASENYASWAVLEASGSVLTNKYAEGYPGKRYYAGCSYVDEAELIAISRCKKLFGADHANVQPHAGSQANMAAYFSVLKPGDTIMGMSLSEGGHLTHGHTVNFSGNLYKSISYGVNKETHLLDYDAIEKLAHEHKPKLIIAGASAYSRTIDFERFSQIAQSVGAYFMADIAHIAGLVAVGLHPSPIAYADFVTSTTHKTVRGPRGGLVMCKQKYADAIDRAIMPGSQGGPFMQIIAAKAVAFQEALQPDFKTYQQHVIANAQTLAQSLQLMGYSIVADGTDNHLFIVDLQNKKITGKAAESALEKAGITASRSCVPNDPQKPWITSGIRFGTPALTTRGITKKEEIQQLAQIIDDVIKNHENETLLKSISEQVKIFCSKYPIY